MAALVEVGGGRRPIRSSCCRKLRDGARGTIARICLPSLVLLPSKLASAWCWLMRNLIVSAIIPISENSSEREV